MRDPARIDEILSEIRKFWVQYPDLRLAQLIVNMVRSPEPCPQVFYFEDDALLQRLRQINADIAAGRYPPPAPQRPTA